MRVVPTRISSIGNFSTPIHFFGETRVAYYGMSDGNIVLLTSWQKLFGQTVLNRMHYVYKGPTNLNGPGELTQFLATVSTGAHWPSQVRQRQSKDISCDRLSAQLIFPKRWAAEWINIGAPGGNAGASIPSNVNIVFQKHVPQADRKGLQGRMHVAGIPTDNLLGDALTGAAYLLWSQMFTTFTQQVVTGAGVTYTPIIWSKARGQATVADIDQMKLPNEVRIMRRRTVGLGI